MKRLGAFALCVLAASCSGPREGVEIQAGTLGITIDGSGRVVSLVDVVNAREYLPPGHAAPLLTLRVGSQDLEPVAAHYHEAENTLDLAYDGLSARVHIQTRDSHATFELLSVHDLSGEGLEGVPAAVGEDPAASADSSGVDLAIWGPYPTTISETIGETVGVVRGSEFALGIQALNPRTLGGYPWNENDAMPQLDIFESGDFTDLSEEGKRYVLYRVEAAKPDSFGSTLQAYTRHRIRERVIPNWGHERYTAPPHADGGIVGSKIALFGSPVEEALNTLGAIELAEGLPHPTIDGQWGKKARSASAAYVIMPFSEATLDRAVDVTLQAGLRYLYHPEPFESWGHFRLGPDFPNGVEGLRRAVGGAESRGVRVGIHTLSNFITTNDPYVTPVPDPRLARVGTSALSGAVSETDGEMGIESPDFFNQFENNHLRAAVVGSEIIRYRTVSEAPPWRLLDVERGAFGTRPERHASGASIGKLADHAYRVFLSDAELTREMATTLAGLFNETGLRQISFDGLEGNRSTGMGNYGEILFTTTWYDKLSENVRSHFIADASRTSHFFWHIYSRMNWGEPWYAGFRESQTEYRLKNQAYFRRNMMPGMLGWFRMQPETSVEDIEWMLARSAAFDAGYAFVTSFEALEGNGRAHEILGLIGLWEEARMADAFTPDQKSRMEDISREFHLEGGEEGGWLLYPIHTSRFEIEVRDRQPGEPTHEVISFQNPEIERGLGFVLTADGASVDGLTMEVDGVVRVDLPVRLRDGEVLVYEGGRRAVHYSSKWKVLGTVPLDPEAFIVSQGDHVLLVDGSIAGGDGALLKLELRIRGDASPVSPNRGVGESMGESAH